MSTNLAAALITIALVTSASLINSVKIFKRKVEPTLSTWVIILAAAVMSLVSYLLAEHKDLIASSLNAADVLSSAIITISILLFGESRWKLKSFEKYYLLGLVLIGLFWIFTSDAFNSNLLVQALITIGYAPTAHTIIKDGHNTESFMVWGLILSASLVSLYPSISAWSSNGNVLALVYSIRSVVLLSLMIALMFIYRTKKS